MAAAVEDVEEWSDPEEEARPGCCGIGTICGGFRGIDPEEDKHWSHLHGAVPAYIRNNFIKKVYSILTVQLFITFFISWGIMSMPAEKLASIGWGFLIKVDMFLVLALTLGMPCCCPGAMRRFPTNYCFLALLTILMSGLVGTICLAYDSNAVLFSVALTSAIFLSLTAFACFTKTDFSGFGPFLFAALSCLVLESLVGIFVQIEFYHMVLAGVGCVLFSFYIVYDTQLIVGGTHRKIKFEIDDYCFAALHLYLDIINLFLSILQLLGHRSN